MFLATNDDGDTPLFRLLHKCCIKADKETLAIIPDRQMSASAKAMTFHKPIRMKKLDNGIYTVNGKPADCVALGLHSGLLRVHEIQNINPKIVVAGINNGFNISMQSFLTSGTIGACLEGLIHGKKGIAFSIGYAEKEHSPRTLELVEQFITKMLIGVAENGFPSVADLISVNFPAELKSLDYAITKLRLKNFEVEVQKGTDPEDRDYLWLGGINHECDSSCKDKECYSLLKQNKITVTPVRWKFEHREDGIKKILW